MSSRIPVIVVSGFLGSGKTTFLKCLIEKTNKKFGLLINEFGDIGIDGDLLKNCSSCNEDSPESIIELNNGCLCCTCLLYTSPSPRDSRKSRMPSSA